MSKQSLDIILRWQQVLVFLEDKKEQLRSLVLDT
jgi:hypothetical protein